MILSDFILPVSPVLALVSSATLIILLEALWPEEKCKSLKLGVALLGPILSIIATWLLLPDQMDSVVPAQGELIPVWLAEFKKSYWLDGLSSNLILAIGFFILVSLVFLNCFLPPSVEKPELYSLVLFAGAGMMLLVSAGSLLMIFMGLELMSLPTYILVGARKNDLRSSEAALKYFLYGSFATVLLVLGIALLYGEMGTLYLEPLRALLNSPMRLGLSGGRGGSVGTLAAFALMLVAIGFKVGLVPYHLWLPDAYQGAPTSITGFMGSAIKLAGFGLAIRMFNQLLLPVTEIWSHVLGLIAVLTILIGNLAALRQTDLKRLFAYSSISHAGYLFLGVASITSRQTDYTALQYYLWVYGFLFLGTFGILAYLESCGKNLNLDSLNGFGFEKPVLGFCFLIFTLSAAGIPPTGGFFAKYWMLLQAVAQDQTEWAVVAVIGSLVGMAYYLRILSHLYMKSPLASEGALPAPARSVTTAIVLCALAVAYFSVKTQVF